jgi:hypothetical protein
MPTSGQKEPGLREKRGESGGSWMVECARLQLLSPTKRAEGAIEQF